MRVKSAPAAKASSRFGLFSGAQIVHDKNGHVVANKGVDQVRPDEARSAGDDCSHGWRLSTEGQDTCREPVC